MSDSPIYHLNSPSISVLGTKTEIRTGSFLGKFIPSIYIIIEDALAKIVVDVILSSESVDSYISRKYIMSGSWINQSSCLYGFFTYGHDLSKNFKIPEFSILAINDGDISDQEIQKRLEQTIKGNYLSESQQDIKEKIKNSMIKLDLEIDNPKTKGLPEYCHKKWFEEIKEDAILNYHKEELNSPCKITKITKQREISTLLETIEFSRSILNEESSKVDYHEYYEILKSFKPRNTDNRMNMIEYYVLNSIKLYNNEKWEFYTKKVKEKILYIHQENLEKFKSSSFNFR